MRRRNSSVREGRGKAGSREERIATHLLPRPNVTPQNHLPHRLKAKDRIPSSLSLRERLQLNLRNRQTLPTPNKRRTRPFERPRRSTRRYWIVGGRRAAEHGEGGSERATLEKRTCRPGCGVSSPVSSSVHAEQPIAIRLACSRNGSSSCWCFDVLAFPIQRHAESCSSSSSARLLDWEAHGDDS
jgi:hypothetical protein